jgi:hypothetical protein
MSALWAHTHLLTSIKIQVQHAVQALEAKISNWLTIQCATQNTAIIQATEDARAAADHYHLLLGAMAGMRSEIDELELTLIRERQQRRDMMRAFEARLQLLEADEAE